MAPLLEVSTGDLNTSRTPSPSPIARQRAFSDSNAEVMPRMLKSPSLNSIAQTRLQPLSPSAGPCSHQQLQPQQWPMVGSPARSLRRPSSCGAVGGYRRAKSPGQVGLLSSPMGALVNEASWGTLTRRDLFTQTFRIFCGYENDTLDVVGFTRLCKQCFLIDTRLSEADVSCIFQKVAAPEEQRLNFQQFEHALELLAQKRGLSMDVIRPAVALCGGPHLQCRTHNGAGSRRCATADLKSPSSKSFAHDVLPSLQRDDVEDDHSAVKVKAQAALFDALFGSDALPPLSPSAAPSTDPNLGLKVKAQTALLEALCGSGGEDEDAAPNDLAIVRVKAQEALLNALQTDEFFYEEAGVHHDEVEPLKEKVREVLHKAYASQTQHGSQQHLDTLLE